MKEYQQQKPMGMIAKVLIAVFFGALFFGITGMLEVGREYFWVFAKYGLVASGLTTAFTLLLGWLIMPRRTRTWYDKAGGFGLTVAGGFAACAVASLFIPEIIFFLGLVIPGLPMVGFVFFALGGFD